MPIGETGIADRLAGIRAQIAQAAHDSGRISGEIHLIAVAKTHSIEEIAEALACGQTAFGENRVQEAQAKYSVLRAAGHHFTLSLIGPLQTNKVKEAVALFDDIQTLDRPKLAIALAAEIARTGKAPRLWIQVNTGAEPQKAGVLPDAADAFIEACRTQHGLAIAGLMCIPPADEPPAPHFALLAAIAARNAVPLLSMGMSADYATAIALGATHVRVGSAIFGARLAAPI
jgi:pyridoxal phosphate enzyme (YggS family)